MKRQNDNIKIFSGNAHHELAKRVCDYLNVKLGDMTCTRFSDGEVRVKVNESARGNVVYIIQPTCSPTNDNLMELLIILDAFRRASVKEINVIIPYFGYARQDKKVKPREPITAALVAKLIEEAGASHVTVCDIHAEQIQGFFSIPVDHLYAGPIIKQFYEKEGYANQSDVCIVSPDVSGVSRAKNLAESLKASIAIVAKRRPDANIVDIIEVIGDVSGKRCIIYDDMCDTGNTLIAGADALIKRGAKSVEASATHLVLSGNASQRLQDSDSISRVVGLDTVPIPSEKLFPKLTILPIAPLLGEAIRRFHTNDSVSELFEKWRTS